LVLFRQPTKEKIMKKTNIWVVALAAISTILTIGVKADPIISVPGTAPDGAADIATALTIVDPGGEIRVSDAYSEGANVTISGIDVTITSYDFGTSVPAAGAAVHNVVIPTANTVVLDGLTIDDGVSGGGNAVDMNSAGSTVTLQSCFVTNGNDGIAVAGGVTGVVNLNVFDTTSTGNMFSGIAIFSQTNLTVNPSNISSNGGNGIFAGGGANNSDITLTDTNVDSNGANGIQLTTGDITINATGCTFNNNTDNGHRQDDTLNITATYTDCEFSGNSGPANGGAILFDAPGDGVANGKGLLTLDSCRITSNTSAGEGGAIAMFDGVDSVITNCIIANNSTAGNFGGVRVWNGVHRVVNNTFHNNTTPGQVKAWSSDGGFATVPGNTTYLVNNIFTGSGGEAIDGGSFGGGPGEVDIFLLNNVLETSTGNGVNPNRDAEVGTVTTDVLYVDLVDFDLSFGSSASGNAATQSDVDADPNIGGNGVVVPSDDIDGDSRPSGEAAEDIGAQESTVVPVELSSFMME
jgi:hypothetical protein